MREPSDEEIREAARETLRSPLFLLGMVLFFGGPFLGPIVSTQLLQGTVEIMGRSPGWWIRLSAFVVWFLVIQRKTSALYREPEDEQEQAS